MVVTGSSSSRLQELRNYTVTTDFADMYISGGSSVNDGVIYYASSSANTYYYIGGIRYNDRIVDGITTTVFRYTAEGTSSGDFLDIPYYKHPDKSKIISQPKIFDDVFIIRDEQSAFDKNYKLEYITNLVELTTYAGGRFFNIVNNT